jgi:NAD-dependent SIR2 family protein deacetylase
VFIGHTSTQLIEREFINYKCRNCKNEWEKEYNKKEDLTGEPICEKCQSKNIFQSLGCTKPLKIGNLFCLDTGAGWDGRLTIMNVETEDFWQSELQTPSIL